jgi:centromere/kinetochore protein ZW10
LQTELTFNEAVTETLEQVQAFCQRLDDGQKAVEEERIVDAIESLETADNSLETTKFSRHGNLKSILNENVSTLRNSIIELLLIQWASEVRINNQQNELRISDSPGKRDCEFISQL